MATYKSNVMEKQTGAANAKLLPTSFGGRVRLVHGTFVPETALAAGTVIELVKLPKGARLLPNSMLHFEAGQSGSLTVQAGDALDADRYLASVSPGASLTTKTLDANRLGDYVLPDETVIAVTTGGAALAAGKKIAFDIFYVVD